MQNSYDMMRLPIAPAKLGSKMCASCDSASLETVEHILFECAGLSDIYNQHWNAVGNVCPDQV